MGEKIRLQDERAKAGGIAGTSVSKMKHGVNSVVVVVWEAAG